MTETIAMQHLSRRAATGFVLLAGVCTLITPTRSDPTEKVPLAIKGYDPVAYFTAGQATRGLPEIEYEWDERRYRFSSDENRSLFKADPARYAPQFASFCAMALARGEIIEADPANWLIHDGKLYLFAKPAGSTLFQQDASRNVVNAEQNRDLVQNR